MITINLNDELSQAVEQMAEQQHKSSVELVTEAVMEMLEDYHDARLAEQAIDEINSGKLQVLSWDDIKAELYDLDN